MGKHYVPQFYLKSFTEEPQSLYIWTYTINKSKPFRTNIKNIAQENDYFTDETEKLLAQTIEGPTNSVIEKITNYETILSTDKKILSDFMSVLIKSVPHGRDRAIYKFDENYDNFFDDISTRLLTLFDGNPEQRDILGKRIEQIKAYQRENKISAKDVWENFLPPNTNSLISEIINSMTWIYLKSKKPAFVTSDNPIFFFEPMGIGKPNSEISFPISPHVTLWCTWRNEIEGSYADITDRTVHEINRRTIDFANKYIYSPKIEEWISKSINKTNHKLNLLNLKIKYRHI